ncbi:hypothetical protein CGMCC3_g9991 [Colletotrichum fructicola]|nr:uncharacterized protein CGMCC3_g9991 [Colletotrichum fructicola]KAE9574147.1 hypothetical protein CGMCC3_g9991 [Colletotrichum fructicola]
MIISIHAAAIVCTALSAVFVNAAQPSSAEGYNIRNAAGKLATPSTVASGFGGASVSKLVKGNVQIDPAYLRSRNSGEFPGVPDSRNKRIQRGICPKGKKAPPGCK